MGIDNGSQHNIKQEDIFMSPTQQRPDSNSSTISNRQYPNVPGKVYTPSHNMLLNPQNPSAPPIPVCGNCQKETRDTDELVLCESGCNFWYHRQCVSLTEEAYKLLKAEIFAEWVCDHCLSTKSIPPVKMKS